MGLDMFLSKKIYIGAKYEHRNVKLNVDLSIKDKKLNIDTDKVSYIIEEVAYWRKADQIHNWFVDNVQNGEDDCNEYDVSIEQLRNLLEVCKEVKQDNKLAETLLPTTEGFFFGGTSYGEYYFEDIEYTIEILEKAIEGYNPEDEFCYRSSW
jgi:hypothetical protein